MSMISLQQTRLLVLVGRIVPAPDRAEWLRFWSAELWCHQHATEQHANRAHGSTGLHGGLVRDACWLRMERCRCVLRGTAMLCLLTLALSCTLALLLALCSLGGWHAFAAHVAMNYGRFLFASPLVLLVTSLTGSRRATHANAFGSSHAPAQPELVRMGFLAAKTALLFLLAYLFGAALCAPVASLSPNTADFLEVLLYVVFSVFALRWTFEDQEQRCRHCLRLLKAPAQVGRPSHNLLEWSGTALVCTRGHGVLSVPELETSWRQTSEWSQAVTHPFAPGTKQLA